MRWTTAPLQRAGAALCLAACATGGAADSGTTFADSAGVTIATGPAEDRPLGWTLTELFRLGGADEGPGSFTSAHSQTVGTDAAGRIYVLDSRELRIEVFDREGRHLRFQGGKGGGPGEFDFAGFLLVHASGTTGVFDYSKRSLVRWGPDGAVLPEQRFDQFFPSTRLWTHGDTLIYVHDEYGARTRGARLRVVVGTDTTDLPGLENPTSGMIMFSCVGLNMPPLFSPSVVYATTGARTAVSLQASYRIDLLDGAVVTRSVRRAVPAEAATASHVGRLYPEGMKVGFGGGRECVVPVSELVEKQGVAPVMPPVRWVALGPAGRLWVQRYTFDDEPARVDVFDAEGRYLGTLDGRPLPLGFIGDDVVLFPEEDEDTGITRLVAYRIQGDRR